MKKRKVTLKIFRWYTNIINKAGLADYGPVKGTMVIKPYGFRSGITLKIF